MPKFSETSLERLASCDEKLQSVCREAINFRDFTISCGWRGRDDQEKAFAEGKSRLHFGQSKHNVKPSRAVDLVPYPIDWDDRERFILFAGFVLGIASSLRVRLRWGGDWNRNGETKDEKLQDLVHFELED